MKSELRSCAHKIRYPTRADALNALVTIRKTNARAGRKQHTLKVYGCVHCNGWHIGHDGAPKFSHYKRVKKIEMFLKED